MAECNEALGSINRRTLRQCAEKLEEITAERDALLGMLSCLKHHHMTKAGISRLVRNTEAAIDAVKGGAK
jgi:hypothetical protein